MRQIKDFEEVPHENLRWRCEPSVLSFETTQELPACEVVIGQERGMKALNFGLKVPGFGYNIFVTGTTAVSMKSQKTDQSRKTLAMSTTSRTRTCRGSSRSMRARVRHSKKR